MTKKDYQSSTILTQGAQGAQAAEGIKPPRLVAFIGCQGSGKSTLIQGLVHATEIAPLHAEHEAANRSRAGNANARSTGITLNGLFATRVFRLPRASSCQSDFLFLDCPGQPEALDEALAMASCADLSLVVIDSHPDTPVKIAPTLSLLAEKHIPHCVVVNKIDAPEFNLDVIISSLQRCCNESILLQQLPLQAKGKTQEIVGLVQLWDESTVRLRADRRGELPGSLSDDSALERACARQEFLESLANFDDALLGDLLEDRLPSIEAIANDLRDTLKNDTVVPVFLTSASTGLGLSQLTRTLDAISVARVADLVTSIGAEPNLEGNKEIEPLAVVMQNGEIQRRGHAICARVLRGRVVTGTYLGGSRVQEIMEFTPEGTLERAQAIGCGDVFVALIAQQVVRGTVIGAAQSDLHLPLHSLDGSSYAQAAVLPASVPSEKFLQTVDQICMENPSLAKSFGSSDQHELILWAPGPVQLAEARTALRERLGGDISFRDPAVPLREKLLGKHEKIQGRYKHQNGGHGAFGDVIMSFEPLAAGSGVVFSNRTVGGVIPAVYLPAIEAGAREALQTGVSGYPIIDVAVTLLDGSTHSVDSSEFAFRQAGRLAVRKMLDSAKTQILEPLVGVRVLAPELDSAGVLRIVAALHGNVREVQPDGDCAREGWSRIQCVLPLGFMPEFIRSARSQCHGNALITCTELPESERYRAQIS